jgi:hypothetical protein
VSGAATSWSPRTRSAIMAVQDASVWPYDAAGAAVSRVERAHERGEAEG